MEENKEISALFHLIDDPDEEVFGVVSNRIVDYGKGIIPNLENLWENTISEGIQERIELVIHRLHYRDLTEEFVEWNRHSHQDLLTGALLVARFQYPELTSAPVFQEVEKLRRNIWLELNSYLTPLEQTNVLTTILYNYYQLKGGEIAYTEPNDFLLNKVLDSKKGNAMSNGILYLVLCDLLDIPIRAVPIPSQFILAYIDIDPTQWNQLAFNPTEQIQFYIDPMSGQVFTQKDVETYFKRISVPATASFFKPLDNIRIIQLLLEELSKCFELGKNAYKQDELLQLASILGE